MIENDKKEGGRAKPLLCSSSRAVGPSAPEQVKAWRLKTSTSLNAPLWHWHRSRGGGRARSCQGEIPNSLQTHKSVFVHIMDSDRPKQAMKSSLTPNFACPFIQPPNPQAQDLQPELGHISNLSRAMLHWGSSSLCHSAKGPSSLESLEEKQQL